MGTLFFQKMLKQNPSHSNQHPTSSVYLPISIVLKIPSDLHYPPNHKLLILMIDYIFLEDIWHNKNNISSIKTIIYTFGHFSLSCHQALQFVYKRKAEKHTCQTKRKTTKNLDVRCKIPSIFKLPPSSILDWCPTKKIHPSTPHHT